MTAPAAWSSTLRRLVVVGITLFTILTVAFSPFGFLLFPAIVGGGIVALILLRSHRFGSQPPTSASAGFGPESPTDIINMARIRVAGFGGLGLVALSIVIALAFPRVGTVMLIGLIGGAIAAAVVVLYRRRQGPMASSDHGLPGARTILIRPEDEPVRLDDHPPADRRHTQSTTVGITPA